MSDRETVGKIAAGNLLVSAMNDKAFLDRFADERAMLGHLFSSSEMNAVYAAKAKIMIQNDTFDQNDKLRPPQRPAEIQKFGHSVLLSLAQSRQIPVEKLLKMMGIGNMGEMIKDHDTLIQYLHTTSQFIG